jgi:hypothetical protein
LYTICQLQDKNGCGNSFTINGHGVQVTLRGELIYDDPGGRGTVCVSLIDAQNQKMADGIYHYLLSKQVVVSEWIDREDFFGPVSPGPAKAASPGYLITPDTRGAKSFVEDFAAAFGMKYQENVEISFPYAGFQVNARSNLLTVSPGNDFLVDFGDLEGDAVTAIEKTGFKVIQITAGMDCRAICDILFSRIPVQRMENPVFAGADRAMAYNAEIQVAGRLISGVFGKGTIKMLITDIAPHNQIMSFLAQKGVRVMKISANP